MPGIIGHFKGFEFYSECNGKTLRTLGTRVADPICIFIRSLWLLMRLKWDEKNGENGDVYSG